MFRQMAAVELLPVLFCSTAPAATALLSGDIQIMFTPPPALPHRGAAGSGGAGVTGSSQLRIAPRGREAAALPDWTGRVRGVQRVKIVKWRRAVRAGNITPD